MIDTEGFANWLAENTEYSPRVRKDTASRVNRADKILEWSDEETYFFYLSSNDDYKALSVSVRSQIKKAVSLYSRYRIYLTKYNEMLNK